MLGEASSPDANPAAGSRTRQKWAGDSSVVNPVHGRRISQAELYNRQNYHVSIFVE